jgi:hypothetical protein
MLTILVFFFWNQLMVLEMMRFGYCLVGSIIRHHAIQVRPSHPRQLSPLQMHVCPLTMGYLMRLTAKNALRYTFAFSVTMVLGLEKAEPLQKRFGEPDLAGHLFRGRWREGYKLEPLPL